MFTEKPMIEAVAAYLDNVPTFVMTEKDNDALFNIGLFNLQELKEGGFRYIVDMPELPEETEKRLEKLKKDESVMDRKMKRYKRRGQGEKPLGQTVYEMRENGMENKEIAAALGISSNSVSAVYCNYKKKLKQKEQEKQEELEKPSGEETELSEEAEIGYTLEKVKKTSIVSGQPVQVDVKKAHALRKAGWSTAKIADEFNISPEDMKEVLDSCKDSEGLERQAHSC